MSSHNIAANVKKFGTGGINIDASRVAIKGDKIPSTSNLNFFGDGSQIWDFSKRSEDSVYRQHPKGRFPTNLVLEKSHDDSTINTEMNKQSGRSSVDVTTYFHQVEPEAPFIYCKKPDNFERGHGNNHPTVKPLNLMRYLAKMITPHGGIVLDPFMGSGSTGVAANLEGFYFLGIEHHEEYFQIANKRLKEVKK